MARQSPMVEGLPRASRQVALTGARWEESEVLETPGSQRNVFARLSRPTNAMAVARQRRAPESARPCDGPSAGDLGCENTG